MARKKSICLVILIFLASYIAVTATPVLASATINPRLYGLDRYQTSTAIAKQFSNVNNVVLASGNDFPDALAASVLAHKLNAPILLVDITTQTSKDALDYIETNLQAHGTVYIVGGNAIISSDFDIFMLSKDYRVKRLGGLDRYETNLSIVNELNSTSESVFIASGENFPDALSISSFASHTDSPILLTQTNTLPQGIQDYLVSKQPKQIYVAGGTSVVSSGVENQIKLILPNSKITRFAGYDRYDTAALIYNQFSEMPNNIYIASGLDYPDALSGTVLAAQNGNPILLINPTTPLVPTSIAAYLSKLHQNGVSPIVTALGGTSVVPNQVVNNVINLLNGKSQSPLFNITTFDSRLIFGGNAIASLPNQDYWFNVNTYKYNYTYNNFHSQLHNKLYLYMLNPDNQVSVHNRAIALHSGLTINNCVYFQSEVLRRKGLNISKSMASVVQFSNLLPKFGFKKDTNIANLKPGDIAFTQGYSHTYTFMGWVNPGKYDYAYVVDNQAGEFNGQVYHVRKVDTYEPIQDTEAMAFFMYY